MTTVDPKALEAMRAAVVGNPFNDDQLRRMAEAYLNALPTAPEGGEAWQAGEKAMALRRLADLHARLWAKPDYADDCLWLKRIHDVLSAAPQSRRELVEECARVADEYAYIWQNGSATSNAPSVRRGAAREIAAAIRKLAEQP